MQSDYISKKMGQELIEQCVELQKLISYRMKALDMPASRTVREEGLSYDVV